MKRWMMCFACVLLLLPFIACQKETPNAPSSAQPNDERNVADAEQIALAIIEQTGWPVTDGTTVSLTDEEILGDRCDVISVERQMLTDNIAHYTFIVQIGAGPYDRIGVHRVVQEFRPNRPIRTNKTVFLQHGASSDFVYCFLPGLYTAHIPDDFGFAIYLAGNNVDVWGIDQRWCLVPPEESNFDFMATWDLPMHSADIGLAVDVARIMRRMTGNGWDKMLLLGYSMGAELSFGLIDGETQLPPGHRRIKGFIPVDMVIRVPDDSPWHELMCSFIPFFQEQIANGIYGEGAIFRPVGILARDDPSGDSPYFPGMDNYQAALALGTTLIYGIPPFHLLAGIFEGDMPVGMEYISNEAWIELLCSMSAVESNVAALDQAYEICGEDVPWNRHWDQISIPVFYVSPRGGFGEAGTYQLGFLGSNEISTLIVSTNPNDILLDYGHLDLFLASNAETMVWQPILAWIADHTQGGPH